MKRREFLAGKVRFIGFTGRERVTLDNFWPDALPFICLVALAGIIGYLTSGN